ncbi:GLPGLI family protein [uncultured Chryseobacterium sp.]|uniref:GLPGLI family protein n=1 Tax=uncultured Chryseobacterium sp. TaxID=259322 RepID=UPI0025F956DA|nr:GLPGLI family protein [uncultured Chryseobacterium sp.]
MKQCLLLSASVIIAAFMKSQGFNVLYEADYKMVYKDQNVNTTSQEDTFALLINTKASYYKNMKKYVEDSLKYEKRIHEKTDFREGLRFITNFPECIGTTSGKLYVTLPIGNKPFTYEETNSIKWQIVNEHQSLNGYRCQKAVTKKYGRTWIAWFTKDIPFPFGPYKFNKLPGLIVEVSDENKDYIFSLYNFRKRTYFCRSANMSPHASPVQKSKVFDHQRREIADPNNYNKLITDPETLSYVLKKARERARHYNPIELSID